VTFEGELRRVGPQRKKRYMALNRKKLHIEGRSNQRESKHKRSPVRAVGDGGMKKKPESMSGKKQDGLAGKKSMEKRREEGRHGRDWLNKRTHYDGIQYDWG